MPNNPLLFFSFGFRFFNQNLFLFLHNSHVQKNDTIKRPMRRNQMCMQFDVICMGVISPETCLTQQDALHQERERAWTDK